MFKSSVRRIHGEDGKRELVGSRSPARSHVADNSLENTPHKHDKEGARFMLLHSSFRGHSAIDVGPHNAPQPCKQIGADPGPLGLNVIYAPDGRTRKADIIFIHGLGGTSRHTWSKNKDPDLFWPLHFLPQDRDIGQARILTFGYDAFFQRRSKVNTSISDFAKSLLFELKFAIDDESNALEIGAVPLIFVVHSMGGLVIKEAYLQGQNDPQYESIVKGITSVIFLATPHRGTNLAGFLNGILTSTFLSNSKQYLLDLNRNSTAIQKLNDQFRHIAPNLDIVSFYETRPTPIVGKNASVVSTCGPGFTIPSRFNHGQRILEKDVSVLGYPGETAKALDADHHNVCKFDGPLDPNYILVRNVLKSLVSKVVDTHHSCGQVSASEKRRSVDLKSLLAITDLPDTDYSFFRDQWVEGTNSWIIEDKTFLDWYDPSNKSHAGRILWISGGPATGKSVLSSFVINQLVVRQSCCQYFYIRAGHQSKCNLTALLRSLVYQLVSEVPGLLDKVCNIADEGIDFGTADARTVWERLFKAVIFRSFGISQPLYWIIDGVDEAVDPRTIVKQFGEAFSSGLDIRILLVSRRTSEIVMAFERISKEMRPSTIAVEGHLDDIKCYISSELNISTSIEYKEEIMSRILERSQNNFLWVRLAVDKINTCYTENDVDAALEELPAGMEALYVRMATSIAQIHNDRDKNLAVALLRCITCSMRMLTVTELCIALSYDTTKVFDIQRSIVDLCAGFVVVDNSGNVAMIHQTAREYLLSKHDYFQPLHIDEEISHNEIFLSSMRSLMTVGLRAKIQNRQIPEFWTYAATYWSQHLACMHRYSASVAEVLGQFLIGPWVLTWIHFLATFRQLEVLVRAARHLSQHFAKRRQLHPAAEVSGGAQSTRESVIEGWAVDLIKLVGKFGEVLRQHPESIYKIVPPFCPTSTSIYQLFGKNEAGALSVSGFPHNKWDDLVGRIGIDDGSFTSSVMASRELIILLAGSGKSSGVFLYNASAFHALPGSPLRPGERIQKMVVSDNGSKIATYGYRTTKVWDSLTGECKISANNYKLGQIALAIVFTENDTKLLVGTDDRSLRSLPLNEDNNPCWQIVANFEEEEIEGHFVNSASFMALNRDVTLAAIAYRGHPPSAWEIEGPSSLGRCWRTPNQDAFGQVLDALWNPLYPELFGIYYEGTLFRWRPYDNCYEELTLGASKLCISRDGNLVATGDPRGTIRVFHTSDLTPLYQVTAEESVFGLAFSPDGCRVYDIRGYHCNVWESNALVRFADQRGKALDDVSDAESLDIFSKASGYSRSGRIDSVTVLAPSPSGRTYAYGTDRGAIFMYDIKTSKLSSIYSTKNLAIEHLEWSNNGRLLSFSYSGRRVVILSILAPETTTGTSNSSKPTVSIQADINMKVDGKNIMVSQLLFDQASKQMAIISSTSIQVVSLSTFAVTKSLIFDCPLNGKWINSPYEVGVLIGVTPDGVRRLDWDLIEQSQHRFELYPMGNTKNVVSMDQPGFEPSDIGDNISRSSTNSVDDAVVDRVVFTKGRKKILFIQLSLNGSAPSRRMFLAFDTSWFSNSMSSERKDDLIHSTSGKTIAQNLGGSVVSPKHFLPPEITKDVALILEFLPRDRLVYISHSAAICTWQLPSENCVAIARNSSLLISNAVKQTGVGTLSQYPGDVGRHALLPGRSAQTELSSTNRSNKPSRGSLLESIPKNILKTTIDPAHDMRGVPPNISAVTTKTLFILPGDWVSGNPMYQCVFWAKEKSLLCLRNGDVASVRCSALA